MPESTENSQDLEHDGPCEHCLFCCNYVMPESYVCEVCADEKMMELTCILESTKVENNITFFP